MENVQVEREKRPHNSVNEQRFHFYMHIKHIIWSRKAVGCKCMKLLWVPQGRKLLMGTFSSDIISLICKLYITFCRFSLKKENKPQLQAFGIWVAPALGGGERKESWNHSCAIIQRWHFSRNGMDSGCDWREHWETRESTRDNPVSVYERKLFSLTF